MKLVTTAEWGANEARNATPSSHPIHSPRGVTLHWIGPGAGGPWVHERCFRLVQSIERSHEVGNGWGDIAYNALVCPHGYVFEGRGPGVRSSANGDTGPNLSHYAVCYLGGEGDPFTDDGKQGFRDAIGWLRSEGGAGPEVNGHRDHKATACPGDVIYAWLRSGGAEPSPPAPDLTRGRDVDAAIGNARRARRKAKGEKRRAVLKAALDALRSLPTWPKR